MIATAMMRGPHAGSSSMPVLWMRSDTLLCLALKAQEYESQPVLV